MRSLENTRWVWRGYASRHGIPLPHLWSLWIEVGMLFAVINHHAAPVRSRFSSNTTIVILPALPKVPLENPNNY
jgi:hypothetical protein